jgi:hypothetical protein
MPAVGEQASPESHLVWDSLALWHITWQLAATRGAQCLKWFRRLSRRPASTFLHASMSVVSLCYISQSRKPQQASLSFHSLNPGHGIVSSQHRHLDVHGTAHSWVVSHRPHEQGSPYCAAQSAACSVAVCSVRLLQFTKFSAQMLGSVHGNLSATVCLATPRTEKVPLRSSLHTQ